ncbi:MAG: elongator complex protein 3, partial [Anaerolineales bacterium]
MVRPFDLNDHRETLLDIFRAFIATPDLDRAGINAILKAHPRDGVGLYSRNELIRAYRALTDDGSLPPYDPDLVNKLKRKPTRTISGVTPVTILTKPFPCPGTCIFCPNDIRMPKSYLADEPGAQRAEMNAFDPYLQTYARLAALHSGGHSTAKVELIILGGTWSFYPEPYQIWFVKRAFDALHDFGAGIDRRAEVRAAIEAAAAHPMPDQQQLLQIDGRELARTYNQTMHLLYPTQGSTPDPALPEYATWDELTALHQQNEDAPCRVVGLVIETRPDFLDAAEALRLRRLGCTKIQIGIQSMKDEVLHLNKRGHRVQRSREALRVLRQAGFKIHAHWMPNLYGSDPNMDKADFARLFNDPDIKPDELKVYPCSLIESAELMQYYERGAWRPYTEDELLDVLLNAFAQTPPYCRLTRVIRDIPGTDIVVGNKKTNFREIVERSLKERNIPSAEIRGREIRGEPVQPGALHLDEVRYQTSIGAEVFLQFVTAEYRIAAFLRLSLPHAEPLTPELDNAAMIREVHVYGTAVDFGQTAAGRPQHAGLGTQLIDR